MNRRVRVAIIGCGKISGVYTRTLQRFSTIDLVACADLDRALCDAHCREWGIQRSGSVDELLADETIDLLVILTPPGSHAQLVSQALKHGKHVYCEKPPALTRRDAKDIVHLAQQKGLMVASAPDTVLGAGLQTARKVLDEGGIGKPTGASAFMLTGGPESWHPNPFFLYDIGGGPLFDMGPYYLSALIHLFGPVKKVAAMGTNGPNERYVGSGPLEGREIPVKVHTHLCGMLDFVSGPLASMTLSFDAPGQTVTPRIEVYGTHGTLVLSDPNTFAETVKLRTVNDSAFSPVPMLHGYVENCRGVGVAELVAALQNKRLSRLDVSIGLHVVDIMQALEESSESGQFAAIESGCSRPAPFTSDELYCIPD